MLAKRIIPTMLVRGCTLVKGKRFGGDRSIGHAQQAARVHAMRGVDELLILDIAATKEGRGPDLGLVEVLSAGCFIPITVGGGVQTIADIDALLRAGADKVSICAAAKPDFISRAADRFGSQAIVVVIEHNDWSDRADIAERAESIVRAGAGEIILQSTNRDGVLDGYDLATLSAVANRIDVPVIVSGGCGGYRDMAEALHCGASGVAAGALFAFTDCTPKGAAAYLLQEGFTVRI